MKLLRGQGMKLLTGTGHEIAHGDVKLLHGQATGTVDKATGRDKATGQGIGTVVDELAGRVSVGVVVSRMRGSFLAANAGL